MAVFIDNEVDAEGLQNIHEELLAMEHVALVRYVSHQQAFENVMAQHEEDPGILEGIPPENFLRYFDIEVSDLRYHDVVVNQLEELMNRGVVRIRQAQNIVHMMIAVSSMVRWISFGLILILAGVSIIIITNTIRITVNARHTEINIMKYVGATDWFIRWPFLIEGILIGIIGSLIPAAAIWTGYAHVIRLVQDGMPIIEFVEFRAGYEIFVFLFPFVISLGALIGAIGSGTSIRKHLHV